MPIRLADRLSAARRRQFVGRDAELAVFRSALTASELPFYILYIHGPGGVGKTTLLQQYALICTQLHIATSYLDAREVQPSPDAFVQALQQAFQLPASEPLVDVLAANPERHVLLLDAFEYLASLDEWLRNTFLPQLPDNLLIVLCGRLAPSVVWRADPGWQTLIRTTQLRNLHPDESRSYLTQRQLPAEQHQAILDFTHGHPLALSLVADMFAQRDNLRFQPQSAPDIIRILLEEFVQQVPGPAHRAALEACALVRVTSESLLSEMLGMPEVHTLFDWLRGLSFIESGRAGLFPHELAREALSADLRWRNRDWYAELHRRARNYYARSLRQRHGLEQQQIMFDYVFLHRDNAMVRPFLEWHDSGTGGPTRLTEPDHAVLLALVAKYEGAESAGLAAHWFALQPHNVTVYRDVEGRPVGMLVAVELQASSDAERNADPVTSAAWQFLQHSAPLRAAERATMFRFWLARDSYQSVSAIQSLIFVNIALHYLNTPALAYTMFMCSLPEFWTPALSYMDIARIEALDQVLAGRRYGVFGHDWRVTPPLAWLDLLAEREIADEPVEHQAAPTTATVVVHDREQFAASIRSALQQLVSPGALRGNTLIRSRLVLERAGPQAGEAERAGELQRILRLAVEQLQASPRELKLYRALYHTYVQPAATQEHAAELLDVPFSSYRRHLRAGIARVTDTLWRWELSGLDSDVRSVNQE